MGKNPSWEANRLSASKKFPAFYGNRRFTTALLKCPPPIPILSQLDPVHAPTSHNPAAYRGGGGFNPLEIPKAVQNRAKLNPIVKTVKNGWI